MNNDLSGSTIIILGILAIAVGIGTMIPLNRMHHKVARAKFNRRNQSGVEEFEDYDQATKVNRKEAISDKTIGCLGTVAMLLILGGLIAVVVGFSQ